ncbi:MAG TPA: DUF72 domain-containing protein, partial [Stellaceae bacterium]|nr:DUF72 domain-containing protein [Stellaceae bacterium]
MSLRVGIGGWVYPPWRGSFYPPGLPQARELAHASRNVTSIEINGTFYGSQRPESFRRWREETPEDFVFSLKAPRFATHRRVLAEAGATIERFLASGVLELGPKLGPILWQFPPTKRFEEEDFAAFLALLPRERDGRPLRHVVEIGHESFAVPGFPALLRRFGVAAALVDSERHPLIAEVTTDFLYARLRRSETDEPTGYAPEALDAWATRLLELAGARDGFVYFINGAKERAPAAAMALLERLGVAKPAPQPSTAKPT